MKNVVRIEYLADNIDAAESLIRYFRGEWPAIYENSSDATMLEDILAKANKTHMPIALVASYDERIIGTVTISEHKVQSSRRSTLWISGFFVDEKFRGQGIGKQLVSTAVKIAKINGYSEIFAGTDSIKSMLNKLGWQEIGIVPFNDQLLSVLRKTM